MVQTDHGPVHAPAAQSPAPPARDTRRDGPRLRAALWLGVLVPAAGLCAHALTGAASAGDAALLPSAFTVVLCLLGGAAVLWGLSPARYPHARLGLCNAVTMLRASGVAVLAGLLLVPGSSAALGWGMVALSAVVLALDGVDGWAARRARLGSGFGARFDVETDVAFALVMAALAWQAGQVGVWFLALGLLRPAFLLGAALMPRLRAPLPETSRRKTVAALQMIGQVVLLVPVLHPPLSTALGVFILGGVALSFAIDLRWLLRAPGVRV